MRGAPGPKAPYTGGFKALDPSPKPPKPSPLPRDKVKSFPIRHTAKSRAAAKRAEEARAAAAAAEAKRKEEEERKRREEKTERSEKKDARKNASGARGGFVSASERAAWRYKTKQKPVTPPGGRGSDDPSA